MQTASLSSPVLYRAKWKDQQEATPPQGSPPARREQQCPFPSQQAWDTCSMVSLSLSHHSLSEGSVEKNANVVLEWGMGNANNVEDRCMQIKFFYSNDYWSRYGTEATSQERMGTTSYLYMLQVYPAVITLHSRAGFTLLTILTPTYLHLLLWDAEDSGSGKLPTAQLHNTVLTHIYQYPSLWCLLLTHFGQLFLIPTARRKKYG